MCPVIDLIGFVIFVAMVITFANQLGEVANGGLTCKTALKVTRFKQAFRRAQRQEKQIRLTNKKRNMNLKQMQMTFPFCPRSRSSFRWISCEREVKVKKQWYSVWRRNLVTLSAVLNAQCPNNNDNHFLNTWTVKYPST